MKTGPTLTRIFGFGFFLGFLGFRGLCCTPYQQSERCEKVSRNFCCCSLRGECARHCCCYSVPVISCELLLLPLASCSGLLHTKLYCLPAQREKCFLPCFIMLLRKLKQVNYFKFDLSIYCFSLFLCF